VCNPLGRLFTHMCLCHRAVQPIGGDAWRLGGGAAAGLVERNDSLSLGLWLWSPAG